MKFDVMKAIRGRRSVRTYSEKPLTAEDRKKLEDFIANLKNPFDVPIEYRFLDAKRDGLSSPVVVGADTYLGGKARIFRITSSLSDMISSALCFMPSLSVSVLSG